MQLKIILEKYRNENFLKDVVCMRCVPLLKIVQKVVFQNNQNPRVLQR